MVVVHELVQPVEDLVGEVAGPQLRDDLLPDAVEDPRQALLFAARQLDRQHAAQALQRPPRRLAELAVAAGGAHHRHHPAVRQQGGQHDAGGDGRVLAPQEGGGESLVAQRRVAAEQASAGQQPLALPGARQPAGVGVQPPLDGLQEMGDQLARRPDLAQVAGQDRREQLVGDFGEVDHWRRGPAKAPPGSGRRHRDGPLILAEAPAERQCGVARLCDPSARRRDAGCRCCVGVGVSVTWSVTDSN